MISGSERFFPSPQRGSDSDVRPVSYHMGTVGFSPGVIAAGA
jgi:hypothetical protein